MVANRNNLPWHIDRLFPCVNDTVRVSKKSATGEGDTVQVKELRFGVITRIKKEIIV